MTVAMASAVDRRLGVEAIPCGPVFVALDRDRVAEVRGELAIVRAVCAALEGECSDLREQLAARDEALAREAALNRTLAGLLDAAERAHRPADAPTPVATGAGAVALWWAALWALLWAVADWFEGRPVPEEAIWQA